MRVINVYNMLYDSCRIRVRTTEEFDTWLRRLHDKEGKGFIEARIARISRTGNLGDFKSVGDGIYELRVKHGPGYRLYFSWRGDELLLLLVGGDKSSQSRDIERAKRISREYR